jgi:hypothetical protein
VTAKDDGAGIAPALLPHVFERGVTGADGTDVGLAAEMPPKRAGRPSSGAFGLRLLFSRVCSRLCVQIQRTRRKNMRSPHKFRPLAALLAFLLLAGCTVNITAPPPTPTSGAPQLESPLPEPMPTPEGAYPTAPSAALGAFAEVLAPRTRLENAGDFYAEGLQYADTGLDGGTPLTFEEYTAFLEAILAADQLSDVKLPTREEYAALPPVNSTPQTPLWADVNGDGADEVITVTGGGGSEGAIISVYAPPAGEYRLLCYFFVGTQNRFTLAEYDGGVFLVVAYRDPILTDLTATPNVYGVYPDEAYEYAGGYIVRRFARDWTPECVVVAQGEGSVPEYDWFYGVHF